MSKDRYCGNFPYVIDQQGAIIVNSVNLYRSGNDIIAVIIDLKSKYIEAIVGSKSISGQPSIPQLLLFATKDSLYLDEGKKRDEITILSFPDHAGWSIWCANTGRYSVECCLVKD